MVKTKGQKQKGRTENKEKDAWNTDEKGGNAGLASPRNGVVCENVDTETTTTEGLNLQ